jgi:hypothetical protein
LIILIHNRCFPAAVCAFWFPNVTTHKGEPVMPVESAIRAIAGSFILISLTLGILVSPYGFLFTAFVGTNLLQPTFTGWCPMETFLRKRGSGRTNP